MEDLEGTLDDDVRALLRGAKDVPDLEVATKARLFADVAERVALPPPPGNEGGSSEGGTGAGPGAASAATRKGALALTGGKGVAALVGTFALGLAAGVVVDRRIAAPVSVTTPPVVASISASAPQIVVAPPADPSGVPIAALPSIVPSSTSPRPTLQPEPTTTPSARGLAAERALLDVARTALARGEAREALLAAQRHANEYPSGSLVEEREALAIKALVALGRRDEARARAQEMERRFPNGLMLRAVKAAVETAPEP